MFNHQILPYVLFYGHQTGTSSCISNLVHLWPPAKGLSVISASLQAVKTGHKIYANGMGVLAEKLPKPLAHIYAVP